MFVRCKKRFKDGKEHRYWSVVENVIDKKPVTFGPLTNEQQGQISAFSRPFQLTIISGSDALGLGQVEQQIDWLLSRSKDNSERWSPVSPNDESRWKRISHVGRDVDSLVAELQKAFRRRSRAHRYAVVRADEIEAEGLPSALFDRFVRDELRGEVLEEEGGEAALESLGLRGSGEALEASVREILRLTEPHQGEAVLVETSFDLAAEALSGVSRTLLEEREVQLRKWMRAMGFAISGRAHDNGSMIVPKWVQGVLKAAGA